MVERLDLLVGARAIGRFCGLTRDQVTDALLAHGYTVKQIADAVLAEYGNDRFGGWKVFDDAELLEFLNRR